MRQVKIGNHVRRLFLVVPLIILFTGLAQAQEVMYTDTWNDEPDETEELPIYGAGVTEEPGGISPEKVETTLYGDSGETLDHAESAVDYYYTIVIVTFRLPWGGPEAPANCSESIHWRYLLDDGFENIGETAAQILPRRFRAIFKKSGYVDTISKWRYTRQIALCTHVCQGLEYCVEGGPFEEMPEWIYIPGWRVLNLCLAIPPWPRPSATQPQCISAGFGNPLVTQTNCDPG